ncbi:putative metalloprotease with PDZ domain [Sphingomonas endophytica]|uniref:Putative metalloprotease with PDZ domain n=1 Tax=Sphingomonas endophytica TaxID=869719 RepID=A0A7X0JB52_9SPHN|nr:PDZ domain-containing protein [Sphingomonas endophytica]MBB6503352.1 putative metalloprotease with PDZ domain [Sphingomonas endophytica]
MRTIGAMMAGGLGVGLGLASAVPAAAQQARQVHYDLSFPDAAHHRAQIVATFRGVPAGPLRVQMARSSPGRYALHEFAKNVFAVTARDGAGRPLPLLRNDPYGWSVAGHDGTVVVSYTVFGNRGDGTYAQIDTRHAHLNPPATLMWATGFDAAPVRVRIVSPDSGWTIATQLPAVAGQPNTFAAPDLQYLMDSPIEIARQDVREWPVGEGKQRYTIRLAVHHDGSAAEVDRLAAQVKQLIPQHRKLFGEWPRFDHGSYTFLADYTPQISGDGMEHRNSTVVSTPTPLDGTNAGQLGTISHEFFHAWNVERLRPRELEPFDFTRANATPSLWFAEGVTNYYGPLMLRRAGLTDVDGWAKATAGALNTVLFSPARRNGGPQEMSLRAPFADAATSIDPVAPDVFLSYYPYGQVVALALDLSIRQRFPARSLDDVMRYLWQTYGRTERPYTPDDLRRGVATVTGDAAFADAFFAASVSGSALPDFAPLLAQAGLVLRAAAPQHGWIGAGGVVAAPAGVMLAAAPLPGSPLDAAGLDAGDRIVAVNGVAVTDPAGWSGALERLTPGATVTIRFVRQGGEQQRSVRALADPRLEIVRVEATGGTLSGKQRAFRAKWIDG